MKRNLIILVSVLVCVLGLTAGIAGCVNPDDLREQVAALEQQQEHDSALLASIAGQLAALPPAGSGTPEQEAVRDLLEAQRESAAAREQTVAALIAQTNAVLAEYERQQEGPIGALANLLPEPYRTPALLIGGAVAVFARQRQLTGAAVRIVKSVEMLKAREPAVAEAFADPANRALIDAVQDTRAKRLVDKAQDKRAPIGI